VQFRTLGDPAQHVPASRKNSHAEEVNFSPKNEGVTVKPSQFAAPWNDHAIERRPVPCSIADSSGDAIVSKDLNSIVTSWNRYTAREMIGTSVLSLIPSGRHDEKPKSSTLGSCSSS
jgi:hypothetical protein